MDGFTWKVFLGGMLLALGIVGVLLLITPWITPLFDRYQDWVERVQGGQGR